MSAVPTIHLFANAVGKEIEVESLVTEKELVALTRLSQSTIVRLRKSGKLPFIRIGGRVLYTPADIRKFIEDSRCGPASPN